MSEAVAGIADPPALTPCRTGRGRLLDRHLLHPSRLFGNDSSSVALVGCHRDPNAGFFLIDGVFVISRPSPVCSSRGYDRIKAGMLQNLASAL